MNFLIVVDMQVDFISGSLGSDDAKAIVTNVVNKVKSFDGKVIFTRDTHKSDYMNTHEGRKLPVEHCIKETKGWQICEELRPYAHSIVDKPSFGSMDLPSYIKLIDENPESIELCGLCTDVCVISNAVILKNAFPEAEISVQADCCAGITKEGHNTALKAMQPMQIEIK